MPYNGIVKLVTRIYRYSAQPVVLGENGTTALALKSNLALFFDDDDGSSENPDDLARELIYRFATYRPNAQNRPDEAKCRTWAEDALDNSGLAPANPGDPGWEPLPDPARKGHAFINGGWSTLPTPPFQPCVFRLGRSPGSTEYFRGARINGRMARVEFWLAVQPR